MTGERHRYLIALGSNRRHPRFGPPARVIEAAFADLAARGWMVEAASPVVGSPPMGPSLRRYANAAAIIAGNWPPPEALAALQDVEALFGRKRRGQRWGARVLDLDIVLWSGGAWVGLDLTIPHPLFRTRGFVLGPAASIAPGWRDPVTRLTVRQLAARARRQGGLTPRAPLPR